MTIESKIDAEANAIEAAVRGDIAEVETKATGLIAKVRGVLTRPVLIAFGAGMVLGVIIKAIV